MALGVGAGGLYGWVAGEAATSVAWLGDLFLNALKMLVLPLIFCSMVDAVSGLFRLGNFRRVAAITFGWYLCTTFIAVVIGLVVVGFIRPGAGVALVGGAGPDIAPATLGSIAGSVFSGNVFEAAARFQVLPVLVFALVFGLGLSAVGEKAEAATAFFSACSEALLKIVGWVMYAAPLGVAALVAGRLGLAGGGEGFLRELAAIGWYFVAVVFGLGLHALVVLPSLLFFFSGRSPGGYAANLGEALMTAFSTASSSATLAVTMDLSEHRNGIRPQTASFVLPMGATVNMDGTALYEAVAAMFIAQAAGLELGLPGQLIIVVTATLASIGAAGIPQAGLVTMVIVLEAVGLPLEGISAILAVDWLLDRFRTTVNVWGDAVGAAVVDAHVDG